MSSPRPGKEFDRYAYYHRAVQSPEADCQFVSDTYKELRGRRPKILREDFCGTFSVCCHWVRRNKDNQAIGVELDPEPLDYGRANYLSKLRKDQQRRIELVTGSVLTSSPRLADVIIAFNFSYFLFKSRLMLKRYFTKARKGLRPGGLFIVDAFGGQAALEPNEERTKHGHFYYYWDQVSYNPINHHGLFHIHFKRKGEAKRKKVFTYDWRLWTIAEICESMIESGFRRTHVYWEGTTRGGRGDGVFKRTDVGDDALGWVVYIVGEV